MIKSKRVLAAALVAALGLTAAACGDDDDEATPETAAPGDTSAVTTGEGTTPPAETTGEGTTPPAETTGEGTTPPAAEGATIGLLFDITGRGDKSFNDAAAAGLDQATDELGIIPSESTPTGDADRADRLNLLVGDGNQLVIGVGFLWSDAIAAGAAANPDTHFAHRRLGREEQQRHARRHG